MRERLKATLRAEWAYWIIALALAAFAWFSFDPQEPVWSWRGVVVYLAPLALLVTRLRWGRYTVFTLSVFVALQAALPSLVRDNYYTLQPNFQKVTILEKGAIPGVEGRQHVSVDARGYRVTKPVDYASAPTGLRVFTIGGSTTEMIYIDDRKTWSHLLQEKLDGALGQDVEVVNTGLSGLRAEQNARTLKRITGLHPRLAIILVGTNDWRRHILNHMLSVARASPRYPWENFSLRNSMIGRLAQAWKDQRRREREDRGAREVETEVVKRNPDREQEVAKACKLGVEFELPPEFPRDVSEAFSEALESIRDTCARTEGLTCVLMTQPHGYRPEASGEYRKELACNNRFGGPNGEIFALRNVDRMGQVADFYNRYLLEFARRHGIHGCDLAAKLAPTAENFFDEVHYTELGAQRVADEVFLCVKDLLTRNP